MAHHMLLAWALKLGQAQSLAVADAAAGGADEAAEHIASMTHSCQPAKRKSSGDGKPSCP